MGQAEKVAIGRFVMRTKEYLVAIQVREGRLSLTTMLWGDEVRSTDGIPTGGKKPAKAEIDQAVALIEALATEWDPAAYKDEYRARLEDVIDRKRKGKKISAPKPEKAPSPVPDLMAALEKSLAEAKGGGGKSAKKGDDLASLSRDELYERAQEEDIPGRSSMSKDELVDALSG
jgi:DNA end-binding protein Ku